MSEVVTKKCILDVDTLNEVLNFIGNNHTYNSVSKLISKVHQNVSVVSENAPSNSEFNTPNKENE